MMYDAPLYNALMEYVKKDKIPFHMPGHKQGAGIPESLKTELFKIDLTELPGTDNLHQPEGAILEAQQKAAQAFGAMESFFLVNGSTCGIQAMIAAVCNPGDTLIIDRNCHSSVITACILCDVIPRYIYPEYIPELGFAGGIDPEEVRKALEMCPHAKGVLITCPSYYGVCSDIAAIADIVHLQRRILMVDEAHGAHFYFHPMLPQGALEAGADICVQSAHKTLPALTQSSMLHVGSNKVDRYRLKNCLKLFQSSSPSYILMAYLDVARSIMQYSGKELLDDLLKQTMDFKTFINSSGSGYDPGENLAGSHYIKAVDMTRIVINFGKQNITGYAVAQQLNSEFGIQVEMADYNNIICIASPGNTPEQFHMLGKALAKVTQVGAQGGVAQGDGSSVLNSFNTEEPSPCATCLTPREAFYKESEIISLQEAAGRVCVDIVTCFPPGIPLLCPGELITKEIISNIIYIQSVGGTTTGLSGQSAIRVVRDKREHKGTVLLC